jgi:hypothetical protein
MPVCSYSYDNNKNSRENLVVVVVIPIVTGLGRHYQTSQPLHASATDLSWDNSTQWPTVVGPQRRAIHAMGEHDTSVGVHRPVQLERRAIVSIWLYIKLAFKKHI